MNIILNLGLLLLLGFFGGKLLKSLRFPEVTGYIITGILIGPPIFNLINKEMVGATTLVSYLALSLIAFTIGNEFSIENLRRLGSTVFWISLFEVAGAFLLVTATMALFFQQSLATAILFGAISSATAPAATIMVVRQYQAKGPFTSTLLSVVAIDDAMAIIAYGIAVAVASVLVAKAPSASFLFSLSRPLMDIFAAFLLGMVAAIVSNFLLRRISRPESQLTLTLGLILLVSGIALTLGFSPLLVNIAFGAVLGNLYPESGNLFQIIKGFDPPIYVVFFVLAGATLEVSLLLKIGLLGVGYVISRVLGKMMGVAVGAQVSKAPSSVKRYLGLGLVPQAGVAIGLALVVKNQFPEGGNLIATTVIAATVIYELIGPYFTKIALFQAKEAAA